MSGSTGQLRALRRLIYCGEWIESHGLHVYMLHAPDFLGYESAVHMAADHAEIVERGLRLKKFGNCDLVSLLGGREIHPINVRVGGFYRVPTANAELEQLRGRARLGPQRCRRHAGVDGNLCLCPMWRWTSSTWHCATTRSTRSTRVGSCRTVGWIDIEQFPSTTASSKSATSSVRTALHSVIRERGAYHVGPMARYNLNFDRLYRPSSDAACPRGFGLDDASTRSRASSFAPSRSFRRVRKLPRSSTGTSHLLTLRLSCRPEPVRDMERPRPRVGCCITAMWSTQPARSPMPRSFPRRRRTS